jgi:uncharacterized membrane protein YuzA (DUF378 family)
MTDSQNTIQNHPSLKRPLSVTLLTWVVLIITALNWLRLIEVTRRWTFLQSLSPALPTLYLAITGLIWGLLGVVLVWGLFLGRSWSPKLMQITGALYAAYYWFDRFVMADPSAISSRWPFALGLTSILLVYTFWIFSRPKTRQFFNPVES